MVQKNRHTCKCTKARQSSPKVASRLPFTMSLAPTSVVPRISSTSCIKLTTTYGNRGNSSECFGHAVRHRVELRRLTTKSCMALSYGMSSTPTANCSAQVLQESHPTCSIPPEIERYKLHMCKYDCSKALQRLWQTVCWCTCRLRPACCKASNASATLCTCCGLLAAGNLAEGNKPTAPVMTIQT